MRFLVDECCANAVVEQLREAGHDVLAASEHLSGATDAQLLAAALSDGRIIVTEDFDFGELLIRDRLASLGAIILFMPNQIPEARAKRLISVIGEESLIFERMISVIENQQVRQRRIG